MCRSGCCSNTAINYSGYVDAYDFSSGLYVPPGVFVCENYSYACGWGPEQNGDGGGNIVIILLSMVIILCCIGICLFYYFNDQKNSET